MRFVVVSSCTVVRSNRGISFNCRDGETVEDMLLANITIETHFHTAVWWGAAEAITVTSVPRTEGGANSTVRNTQFQDSAPRASLSRSTVVRPSARFRVMPRLECPTSWNNAPEYLHLTQGARDIAQQLAVGLALQSFF